jgi:predicted PurR-regulated permease PerM
MMEPRRGVSVNLPSNQMTGARVLTVAASIVIVIAGLKAASSLILPFLSALFLAMISLPLLNFLQERRIPTPLAASATLLTALGLLAGIVTLIGGSVRAFTARVPVYQARLNETYSSVLVWFRDHGIDLSDRLTIDLINPSAAFDVAQGVLSGTLLVVSNFFLVFLTIAFILFEAAGFPDKLQRAFGSQASSERFDKIVNEVQKYLGIKTLVSLATGIFVGIALAIMGIDFALLWGALAFLLNYIPNLGSIIAAVPPVLLAIVQKGFGWAIGVAVLFVVVNVVMGNIVEPRLMGRRLGLSTLVVFLSLVFWGWVWGPMGMLLSVPLTMILKINLENTDDMRWVAILLGPGERPKRN